MCKGLVNSQMSIKMDGRMSEVLENFKMSD